MSSYYVLGVDITVITQMDTVPDCEELRKSNVR